MTTHTKSTMLNLFMICCLLISFAKVWQKIEKNEGITFFNTNLISVNNLGCFLCINVK